MRSALGRSVALTAARSAGEGEGQALLREPRGQTRLLLDGGGGDGTGAALGTLLEAALTGLAGGLGARGEPQARARGAERSVTASPEGGCRRPSLGSRVQMRYLVALSFQEAEDAGQALGGRSDIIPISHSALSKGHAHCNTLSSLARDVAGGVETNRG